MTYTKEERAIAELFARKFWNKPLDNIGPVTRNELLALARKAREILEGASRY